MSQSPPETSARDLENGIINLSISLYHALVAEGLSRPVACAYVAHVLDFTASVIKEKTIETLNEAMND